MKRPLERLLHIRQLLENLSHLEFERKTAEVRLLEQGAERQRRRALTARSSALAQLESPGEDATPAWLVGVADAEILGWKRVRLAARAAARRPALEAARADLLARRLERRQAETLAAAAAAARERKQRRREQSQVDDWFQSRAARRADSVTVKTV
jgi:flagellar biosynthesis chaperone FliJ